MSDATPSQVLNTDLSEDSRICRLGLIAALCCLLVSDLSLRGSEDERMILSNRLRTLEVLRDSKEPEKYKILKDAMLSKHEHFAVRRLAARLLSVMGDCSVFNRNSAPDKTDVFWPCFEIAAERCRGKVQLQTTQDAFDNLVQIWQQLESVRKLEDRNLSAAEKETLGLQSYFAAREVAFHAVDMGVPLDSLPSEIAEFPDIAYGRLVRDIEKIRDPEKRIELLLEKLQDEGVLQREAAVRFLSKCKIDDVLWTRIIKLLHDNLPTTAPPPFDRKHAVFRACIEILAASGDQRAREELEIIKQSRIEYNSTSAKYFLLWIESKSRYPTEYIRLMNELPFFR